jgi:hypothetical protein
MSLFSRAAGQQPQSLSEVLDHLGPRARRAFKTAMEISHPYSQLDSGALLAALADEPSGGAGLALYGSGVRIAPTLIALEALEPRRVDLTAKRALAPVMHRILSAALEYERRRQLPNVTTDLLLEALLNEPDSVAAAILSAQLVEAEDVRANLRDIVRSGEASDDFVFSTSGPIVESIDLNYPVDLVWALIEPPENAPLVDPNVVAGERRLEADGREIHILRTKNPAPDDVLEFLVTQETPGRRARIVQTLPASPRATATIFEITPVGAGSRLRLESTVEVGSLRRRDLGFAGPELQRQLRASLEHTRAVLDEGWRPNARV